MAEAEANGNIARVNNTSIPNFNLDICYQLYRETKLVYKRCD
jgi:hypothetical protein